MMAHVRYLGLKQTSHTYVVHLLTYGTKRFLVEKLNAKPLFEAILELIIIFYFSLIFFVDKLQNSRLISQ